MSVCSFVGMDFNETLVFRYMYTTESLFESTQANLYYNSISFPDITINFGVVTVNNNPQHIFWAWTDCAGPSQATCISFRNANFIKNHQLNESLQVTLDESLNFELLIYPNKSLNLIFIWKISAWSCVVANVCFVWLKLVGFPSKQPFYVNIYAASQSVAKILTNLPPVLINLINC